MINYFYNQRYINDFKQTLKLLDNRIQGLWHFIHNFNNNFITLNSSYSNLAELKYEGILEIENATIGKINRDNMFSHEGILATPFEGITEYKYSNKNITLPPGWIFFALDAVSDQKNYFLWKTSSRGKYYEPTLSSNGKAIEFHYSDLDYMGNFTLLNLNYIQPHYFYKPSDSSGFGLIEVSKSDISINSYQVFNNGNIEFNITSSQIPFWSFQRLNSDLLHITDQGTEELFIDEKELIHKQIFEKVKVPCYTINIYNDDMNFIQGIFHNQIYLNLW